MYLNSRRLTRLTAALAAAITLVAVIVPGTARAQEPPPYNGDVAPEGASLATAGDTGGGGVDIEDLVDGLRENGCDVVSVAITEDGDWLVYIPGAPAFVNVEFPATLPEGTPFSVLCRPEDEEPTPQDAVDLLEGYFEDLDNEDYQAAYDAWEDGQIEQTFTEFVAGYANTASITAEIGEPGRVEGAAGSRFIDIPVTIESTLDDGTTQTFEGTYVLRRVANIPGSTQEQRMWHIYSADVEQID